MKKFSLELHPEKTRLIRFGRFAGQDSRRFEGRRKPETFEFLGFTHYCGTNRNGKFLVGRVTMCKRLTAWLQEVAKAGLRNRPPPSYSCAGELARLGGQGLFPIPCHPRQLARAGCFSAPSARGCGIKPYADAATSPASTGTAPAATHRRLASSRPYSSPLAGTTACRHHPR